MLLNTSICIYSYLKKEVVHYTSFRIRTEVKNYWMKERKWSGPTNKAHIDLDRVLSWPNYLFLHTSQYIYIKLQFYNCTLILVQLFCLHFLVSCFISLKLYWLPSYVKAFDTYLNWQCIESTNFQVVSKYVNSGMYQSCDLFEKTIYVDECKTKQLKV